MWPEVKYIHILNGYLQVCMYHMGKIPLGKLGIDGRITLEVILRSIIRVVYVRTTVDQ